MDNLELEETTDTPAVILDASTGTIGINGKSYMEDAATFYDPVMDWVSKYLANSTSETTMNLDLKYFNSTTSKYLLKMFFMFEDANRKDNLKVNWHYSTEDDLIKERGVEMQTMVGMEFTHIPY